MRAIKFRLIKGGKIVGYEYHEQSSPYGIRIFHSKPDEVIKWDIREWRERYIEHDSKDQFTELKDKNGVEIYEGDWLQFYNYNNEKEFIDKVEYRGSGFYCRKILDSWGWDCEIIGNIWEHPELIKE